MKFKPDGLERPAWALRNTDTGLISLVTLSDTQREADEINKGTIMHASHQGKFDVVAVTVTISLVGDGA